MNLAFLDGARGLAALFVVIHHARMLLWEGYSSGYKLHPQSYSLANKALMALLMPFADGHAAVLFFFVLSGFVIHLRYSRALKDSPDARFDTGSYAFRRIKRLYPPLLFALLLTTVLDLVGARYGLPIYTRSTPYPVINANITTHHDVRTLIGNLAFLMRSQVPVWGTDSPLWSLHYEWWFYVLYPAFWWLSKRSAWLATGVMTLAFGLSFVPALWHGLFLQQIFGLMLSWWFGVILADLFTQRVKLGFAGLRLLTLAALAIPLLRSAPQDLIDTLTALSFSGLLAICFARLQTGKSLRSLERLKPLGDLSYSLYVTHFPIVVLISAWLMSCNPASRLPIHFGWVAVGTALSVAVAYLVHLVVEKPFTKRKAA